MAQQTVPGIDPHLQQACDAFRRDYRSVQAEIGKAIVGHNDIVMKKSTDGGRSWGPLKVVAGTGDQDAHGNPAPVVDAATGRVSLLYATGLRLSEAVASKVDELEWGEYPPDEDDQDHGHEQAVGEQRPVRPQRPADRAGPTTVHGQGPAPVRYRPPDSRRSCVSLRPDTGAPVSRGA